MIPIADDEHYYNQFQNDDGWIVGMNRAIYGVRVVIYHKDDHTIINGNLCAGSDPIALIKLYAHLSTWIASNPKDVREKCRYLHSMEKVRPYGKDEGFKKAIEELNN